MGVRVVALALGSNLGCREEFLAEARKRLEARFGPMAAVSRVYETDPVGPPGQGRYLNQVVLVRSGMHPEALLEAIAQIETELGRTRETRWGPRTIDIDILLCDGETWETERVTVPHPELAVRAFVLAPLAELLPEWCHPRSGASVAEMLARCDLGGRVAPAQRAG
jgi:2-amino-4-hydroxy-6-hydroxymethyldihydropteridine diphosphokinase